MLSTDQELADNLRREDPEQFITLVRMHLSFVLDLNTDEGDCGPEKKSKSLKWSLFNKKPKGNVKGTNEVILSLQFINQVNQLIEFLSQTSNIIQEGIFRRSGKLTRQQGLKTLLQQGAQINLNDSHFSVHDCASVLKNLLSELPESVLSEAYYPAYCQIAEYCDNSSTNNEDRLLKPLQLLLLLLPAENRNFMRDIIQLLHLAASHEDKNKMSADNLATLFTPHLLCPKKLSPEALHTNSQVMSKVVAFMIQRAEKLFDIPGPLATDIRAYWDKKERRKQSPLKHMNESICDSAAANTVFTFVDREKTAQANGTNPTETALAELYAHIQSLPESSKKKKLIKQFNKENGCGTPLHASRQKKHVRRGSLGDSLKKHLPGFSKVGKNQPYAGTREVLASIQTSRLLQNDSSKKLMPALKGKLLMEDQSYNKLIAAITPSKSLEHLETIVNTRNLHTSYSKSCEHLEHRDELENKNSTNESDCTSQSSVDTDEFNITKLNILRTRKVIKRRSPNSCLTQEAKTPRLSDENCANFNETMMTPRSRKPVVSLSGTDLCDLASMNSWNQSNEEKQVKFSASTKSDSTSEHEKKKFNETKFLSLCNQDTSESTSNDSISSVFRDYLYSRSILTASPVDLSFSSRTDDFESSFSESSFSKPENILNNGTMSNSLLYCLDGNDPNDISNISGKEKRCNVIDSRSLKNSKERISYKTFNSDMDLNSPIHETAL